MGISPLLLPHHHHLYLEVCGGSNTSPALRQPDLMWVCKFWHVWEYKTCTEIHFRVPVVDHDAAGVGQASGWLVGLPVDAPHDCTILEVEVCWKPQNTESYQKGKQDKTNSRHMNPSVGIAKWCIHRGNSTYTLHISEVTLGIIEERAAYKFWDSAQVWPQEEKMECKRGKRYHCDIKSNLKKRKWTTYKEMDSTVIEYSTPEK